MRSYRVPAGVGLSLLVVYTLTLAPGVTYWDSGEFLAAIRTLGIPHPPGTPLYILVGNVWAKVFGPVVGFAYAVSLLSAVSTAAACAIFAHLMHRWTRDAFAATAGGLLAGLMSSVWLNANETEVYAPALLVSILLVLIADNARVTGNAKWLLLFAYMCGLGWALQLSALVAAPGAVALLIGARHNQSTLKLSFATPGVVLLGASGVLFMLVRAQHDPGVNQGNPSTWQAFLDVIERTQYLPVSIWPRQAPIYIQVGNVFEYADWQIALGLAPDAPPSWLRTPFSVVFGALGVTGWWWHRAAHRVTWRAMSILFVVATLGVVAYLNMKAGPSYGHGFLAPGAPHEARERDYFFALAFVCWGMWAGAGAVRLFARMGARARFAGLAVAVLPFFLNYGAVDRSRAPESTAALDSAKRILIRAPQRAVVFAYGDNDTYPVWYAQQVLNLRRDVTVVTVPLLGAEWYRLELRRRHGLMDTATWRGAASAVGEICVAARMQGRPIVAAVVRDRVEVPASCR